MHFPTLSILACVALVLGCHRRLGGEATLKTVRNVPFGETIYKAEDSFSQGHLGFKAWPVNAADGGLVGVAAEIHNLSKDKPLRLQSVTGSIPIGVLLAVARGNKVEIVIANSIIPMAGHSAAPDPRRVPAVHSPKYLQTRWALPASTVKRYFIPIRFFASQLPAEDRIEGCYLHVSLGAYPDWISEDIFEPSFPSLYLPQLVLSKTAMKLDPRQALAEALEGLGKANPAEFTMPPIPQ
ncbi:MAG: hypothetical protein JWL59_2298 [Chthoniobacteraceae bacterium]|nr:hypothetical protein [Chthoniobacteraceae bacterium]